MKIPMTIFLNWFEVVPSAIGIACRECLFFL
jgi:hypothetical protein